MEPSTSTSTYSARRLWARMLQWFTGFVLDPRFKHFCKSAVYGGRPPSLCPISSSIGADTCTWPVPPLCGDLWRLRNAPQSLKDSELLGLCDVLTLCYMNWITLGRPAACPTRARCGARRSLLQQRVAEQLHESTRTWDQSAVFEMNDLGRQATKYENIDCLLQRLADISVGLQHSIDPYGYNVPTCRHDARVSGFRSRDPESLVIGHLNNTNIEVAKDIDASRLVFKFSPGFDPRCFFDPETLLAYDDPDSLVIDPPFPEIPRVRIRGSREAQLELYKKLDDTGRLALVPSKLINQDLANGLFDVVQDSERDRLVLDGKPPNYVERVLKRWTQLMAAAVVFTHYHLPHGKVMAMYGEDLVDYYYEFLISEQRVRRNAMKGRWNPWEFRDFRCFNKRVAREEHVNVCLKTMAMGDHNACEFGQMAHLKLAVGCAATCPSELVHLHALPPDGPMAVGVIQDDFGLFELEDAVVDCETGQHLPQPNVPPNALGPKRIDTIRAEYEKHGLHRHPTKAVFRSFHSTHSGGEIDGLKGTVRSPLLRSVALCTLTLKVIELGRATVTLLQALAGSCVAIFLYRRRLLCFLDLVFHATKGRLQGDVIYSSAGLRTELFGLILFSPYAFTNMRAGHAPVLTTVDASNQGYATVTAAVTTEASHELCRQSATKSSWAKLLRPAEVWRRNHGVLPLEQELPGVSFEESLPWKEIVGSLTFEIGKLVLYRGRPPHINLGELDSLIMAETEVAKSWASVRMPTYGDSQVSAGCLTKGRSASAALNDKLQRAVSNVLGADLYNHTTWGRSATNPADDPTRGAPLRGASCAVPPWFKAAMDGNRAPMSDHFSELAAPTRDIPSVAEMLPLGPKLQPSHRELRRLECSRSLKTREAVVAHLTLNPCHVIPSGASLSSSAAVLLSEIPLARFLRNPISRRDADWAPTCRGALDLYSGSKRFARALLRSGAPWVLTFDINDGADQDLTCAAVRLQVERLVDAGCFLLGVMSPVCKSFSCAVTPPVRSLRYPAGVPWASAAMLPKLSDGTSSNLWCARVWDKLHASGCFAWCENPGGSWWWKQSSWILLGEHAKVFDLLVDQCCFGAPWKKITRFRTNISDLQGFSFTCDRTHTHQVLRSCPTGGRKWTNIAEAYPYLLADFLAAVCSRQVGWLQAGAIQTSTYRRPGGLRNI